MNDIRLAKTPADEAKVVERWNKKRKENYLTNGDLEPYARDQMPEVERLIFNTQEKGPNMTGMITGKKYTTDSSHDCTFLKVRAVPSWEKMSAHRIFCSEKSAIVEVQCCVLVVHDKMSMVQAEENSHAAAMELPWDITGVC